MPRIPRVLRFTPTGDISDTKVNIPPTTIRYSQLTSDLKDRIAEVDPVEHELLEWIIIQAKKINLHLMSISGENITENDIKWP